MFQNPIQYGKACDVAYDNGSGANVGVTWASITAALAVTSGGAVTVPADVAAITPAFLTAKNAGGTLLETVEMTVYPAATDLSDLVDSTTGIAKHRTHHVGPLHT